MSNRRYPNVVTAQILEICRDGAYKTRVVYQANLNSVVGAHYLDNLMKKGLIEAIPDGSRFIYRTTPKGRQIQERLGEFGSVMEQIYSNV